jgi:hypothetical protein
MDLHRVHKTPGGLRRTASIGLSKVRSIRLMKAELRKRPGDIAAKPRHSVNN